MTDYGSVGDGRCEFSMGDEPSRCTALAVRSVTFGQHGGWTYAYCEDHARRYEPVDE